MPGRAAKDEGVTGLEHHVGVGRTPSLVVADARTAQRAEVIVRGAQSSKRVFVIARVADASSEGNSLHDLRDVVAPRQIRQRRRCRGQARARLRLRSSGPVLS